MTATRDDFLLEEATAFDAVASSDDPGQSAYEQAAIRIETWMQRNPGQTQRDTAARIGKDVSYVNRLLKELLRSRATGTPFRMDWRSGANTRTEKDQRALAQASPEVLIEAALQAIEQAPPGKQRKLVRTVANTSTVAGRHIANAVRERDRETLRQLTEREPAAPTGIPLPAMWASMSVTLDKWVRELSRFTDDDLDELAYGNPDGADQVAGTVDRLNAQGRRWARRLRRQPDLKVVGDGGVIEGHAQKVSTSA